MLSTTSEKEARTSQGLKPFSAPQTKGPLSNRVHDSDTTGRNCFPPERVDVVLGGTIQKCRAILQGTYDACMLLKNKCYYYRECPGMSVLDGDSFFTGKEGIPISLISTKYWTGQRTVPSCIQHFLFRPSCTHTLVCNVSSWYSFSCAF